MDHPTPLEMTDKRSCSSLCGFYLHNREQIKSELLKIHQLVKDMTSQVIPQRKDIVADAFRKVRVRVGMFFKRKAGIPQANTPILYPTPISFFIC